MPTWAVVVFWLVLAAVAVGAYFERRSGHRYTSVEPPTGEQRAEFEGRSHLRGHDGSLGA